MSYKRSHLRAPCFSTILFGDQGYIFKAHTLNISEGGMLLKDLPHFPEGDKIAMMIQLDQYPSLINFGLDKLKNYTQELFPSRIIRLKGKMVRKDESSTGVDEVFRSRIGLQFTELSKDDQRIISEYVTVFASNVFHLQNTLESVNSNHEALEKGRLLAAILGYPDHLKISQLRLEVARDYHNLSIL